ncbi:hypothetical protein AC578_9589 [Pseudocercospora eumusae]|uniref:DUF6594 domain-containing protein n=1 Tax=Pseudocercospora eumusae TaxID=321146 RepID=A0A139GY04_9PEZI|nr:hypothetical protein AC578_9589 [Pseudocercospora eumusae]
MSYVHGPLLKLPKYIQSLCTHTRWLVREIPYTKPSTEVQQDESTIDDREHVAAWKFVGYPGLSKWLVQSPGRLTLRRFQELQARVLLKQQNEIAIRERELKHMDDWTMDQPSHKGGCGSLRLDEGTVRDELLTEIGDLLRDYNGMIDEFSKLQEQPNATADQIGIVQHWFAEHPNVVESPEQEFVSRTDDLIAVGSPSKPSLDECLPKLRFMEPLGSIVSLLPLAMLLVPAWAMSFACDCGERMVIVTSFTVVFCLFLTSGTSLGPSHRNIATAGYFVILIMTLGLIPMSKTARFFLSSQQVSPTADVCEVFRSAVNRTIQHYHHAAIMITIVSQNS